MKYKIVGTINFLIGIVVTYKLLGTMIISRNYSANIFGWSTILIALMAMVSGPMLLFKPTALNNKIWPINKLVLVLSIFVFIISVGIMLMYMVIGSYFMGIL